MIIMPPLAVDIILPIQLLPILILSDLDKVMVLNRKGLYQPLTLHNLNMAPNLIYQIPCALGRTRQRLEGIRSRSGAH